MKPNKKIDRLFQEKLKDLEVSPPDIVWENIEAHLDKKRGKRLIPLWWRMAGAAAILLSIATGGFYLLNTPSISIPSFSITTLFVKFRCGIIKRISKFPNSASRGNKAAIHGAGCS